MDGWIDGWMDRWIDGWMNGWTDEWVDGWLEYCFTAYWQYFNHTTTGAFNDFG